MGFFLSLTSVGTEFCALDGNDRVIGALKLLGVRSPEGHSQLDPTLVHQIHVPFGDLPVRLLAHQLGYVIERADHANHILKTTKMSALKLKHHIDSQQKE